MGISPAASGVRWFPTVPRSDFFRDEITLYLRHITPDQVRRLREKWQEMLTTETKKRNAAIWNTVWATLPDALSEGMKASKSALSTT